MTKTLLAFPPETPGEDRLAELLLARLLRLPYLAYALCVQRVLERVGYESLRPVGRRHFRGPHPMSAVDLVASLPGPLGSQSALVQIKRYEQVVARRFVDELRGAMIRNGAPSGVLVTTSRFSGRACEAATSVPGRPIRLVNGTELANLMIALGLGIAERVDLATGRRSRTLDEDTFAALERFAESLVDGGERRSPWS
jgi:restriction endonuclease Mrr